MMVDIYVTTTKPVGKNVKKLTQKDWRLKKAFLK